MKIDEVRELDAQSRFYYWVDERIKIYNNKVKGVDVLTDDEILQKYHFTNVKRENDKVSKWLINEVYNHTQVNQFEVILISRFINNPESLIKIKDELIIGDFKEAKKRLEFLASNGMTIFRSAYLQPEIKGMNRFDKIFDYLLPKVSGIDVSTNTLRESITDLMKVKYLGEFISGQISMDAMLFVDGLWADKNTYAPMGPGSIRGLNRFIEQKLTTKIDKVDYNAYLLVLAENTNLRALDIEHSLCEWDKYERILWSDGSYNRYYKK